MHHNSSLLTHFCQWLCHCIWGLLSQRETYNTCAVGSCEVLRWGINELQGWKGGKQQPHHSAYICIIATLKIGILPQLSEVPDILISLALTLVGLDMSNKIEKQNEKMEMEKSLHWWGTTQLIVFDNRKRFTLYRNPQSQLVVFDEFVRKRPVRSTPNLREFCPFTARFVIEGAEGWRCYGSKLKWLNLSGKAIELNTVCSSEL